MVIPADEAKLKIKLRNSHSATQTKYWMVKWTVSEKGSNFFRILQKLQMKN